MPAYQYTAVYCAAAQCFSSGTFSLVVEGRDHQGVAAFGKVSVQGASVHMSGLGDLIKRHSVDAELGELRRRRLDDQLTSTNPHAAPPTGVRSSLAAESNLTSREPVTRSTICCAPTTSPAVRKAIGQCINLETAL